MHILRDAKHFCVQSKKKLSRSINYKRFLDASEEDVSRDNVTDEDKREISNEFDEEMNINDCRNKGRRKGVTEDEVKHDINLLKDLLSLEAFMVYFT